MNENIATQSMVMLIMLIGIVIVLGKTRLFGGTYRWLCKTLDIKPMKWLMKTFVKKPLRTTLRWIKIQSIRLIKFVWKYVTQVLSYLFRQLRRVIT